MNTTMHFQHGTATFVAECYRRDTMNLKSGVQESATLMADGHPFRDLEIIASHSSDHDALKEWIRVTMKPGEKFRITIQRINERGDFI